MKTKILVFVTTFFLLLSGLLVAVGGEAIGGEEVKESVEKLREAAYFAVQIDTKESDTEGAEGRDLVIVADIENIGEEDELETQTIKLYDEGAIVLDDQKVSLGPGETERVYLTWETELEGAGDEAQTSQLEVASEDDDNQIFVELNPVPNLNFVTETWYIDDEDMNPENGFELEEGDTLIFEGQIKNEGGASIFDALVKYKFPGDTEKSENIDLEVNETVNVSAEWNVRVIDNPEISIWVNSTSGDGRTHDEIRYFADDFEDIASAEITFEDLDFPDQEMVPGESYSFGGRVVRASDNKNLSGIEVVISLKSISAIAITRATTSENGGFLAFLQIPDDAAGEYALEFAAQTYNIQSTQVSVMVEEDNYTLNVTIEGKGTVNIDPERKEYEPGTEVNLTASPDEHWYFEGFVGDYLDTEENITIIMDGDKDITAVFKEHIYNLNITINGEGIVEIDPEREGYEPCTEVNLTAIADEDWYLFEWVGNYESFDEEITITMDKDKEITAQFKESGPYFTVKIIEYDKMVEHGEDVTVEYKITNRGDTEDTQDIVFYVNEEPEEVYLDLTLAPDENHTEEFVWETEEGGAYILRISSNQEEKTVTGNIEEDSSSFLSNYWWLIALIVIVAAITIGATIAWNRKKHLSQ